MKYRFSVVLSALLLLMSCKEASETPDPEGASDGDGEAESLEYRILLGNALTDTLSGDGIFGRAFDPRDGSEHFVIQLDAGFGLGGGFAITRSDSAAPSRASFDLAEESDFRIIYREGLRIRLHASSGQVAFDVVSDTLVEGRLDANLRGAVTTAAGPRENAEVHARGRFRAIPGSPAYFVGL